MRVHRGGDRPGTGPARRLAALRAAAASALVLGTVAFTAGSAAAQADEDAGTYESPTFGYTLEWNPEDWTVSQDVASEDASSGRDLLTLFAADTSIQLYAEGSEGEWSDTDECVTTVLDEAGLVFSEDFELASDPADGEPVDGGDFEVSEDGYSRAAYSVEADLDGDTIELAFFAECHADPDSDLIVAFSGASLPAEDFLDTSYPAIEDVILSLPFANSGSAGDDDEGTPVADDDEDASPSARGSRDDEDEDATPESGGEGGVDGNVYTSPTYGYELEFDEDLWTVEDESSSDDIDTLVLESDLLTATISGFTQPDDLEGCIDYQVDALTERGTDANVALDGDGEEAIFTSDDDSRIGAFLFYTDENGDELFVDFYCYPLGGDEYLGIDFVAPQDTFTDDANSDQITELIEGILGGVTF